MLGLFVGTFDGTVDGNILDSIDGSPFDRSEGITLGLPDGTDVGQNVRLKLGSMEPGRVDGKILGMSVGRSETAWVGIFDSRPAEGRRGDEGCELEGISVRIMCVGSIEDPVVELGCKLGKVDDTLVG